MKNGWQTWKEETEETEEKRRKGTSCWNENLGAEIIGSYIIICVIGFSSLLIGILVCICSINGIFVFIAHIYNEVNIRIRTNIHRYTPMCRYNADMYIHKQFVLRFKFTRKKRRRERRFSFSPLELNIFLKSFTYDLLIMHEIQIFSLIYFFLKTSIYTLANEIFDLISH